MNITIEKLRESDDEKLFAFELENRAYFERNGTKLMNFIIRI